MALIAAVSARSILGPSRTFLNPTSVKNSTSALSNPFSGPQQTLTLDLTRFSSNNLMPIVGWRMKQSSILFCVNKCSNLIG